MVVPTKKCVGNHWLHFYMDLMQRGTFSSERLRDIALAYQPVQQRNGHAIDPTLVRDPLPVDFELKYTPPSEVAPFQIIAHWMEQLIDQSTILVDRR